MTSMSAPPYRVAVIGRTGRGDYGHQLDVALLDQPRLTVVAVADEDAKGRAAAANRRGGGEDLLVLGPHIMDVYHDLLGEPAWCFARVTENGRPITRASVRDGAEGLGPLAGDRIDAMYGFVGTPAIAHFATARPREG